MVEGDDGNGNPGEREDMSRFVLAKCPVSQNPKCSGTVICLATSTV
jgi:hypothetical protein